MLKTFLLALCCGLRFHIDFSGSPLNSGRPAFRFRRGLCRSCKLADRPSRRGAEGKAAGLFGHDRTVFVFCGKARGLCNQGKRTANASLWAGPRDGRVK
jgi:hypothetical protein